jgi:hypothetical protein
MYIDQWSKVTITLMKSWIRIRSKVKSWTRISIKVIRIRNLDFKGCFLSRCLIRFSLCAWGGLSK